MLFLGANLSVAQCRLVDHGKLHMRHGLSAWGNLANSMKSLDKCDFSRYIGIVNTMFISSISALRPKQWVKNLLLFVAPFAAGARINSEYLTLLLGFFAFSIASSIGYIINDINDVEIDRMHPKKRSRPFASGALEIKSGFLLIISLLPFLIFAILKLPNAFNLVLFLYMLNTLLYTKFLKRIAVVEMFSVAFGFVLRLIAGALVMGLGISEWFLIVGGFGALFIVSSKRLAELKQIDTREVRKVVREYSAEFLTSSTSISVAVTLTAYCFWAFNQTLDPFWFQISVIPFVMGLFRYQWLSERLIVETPEDAILSDKPLMSLSLSLVLVLGIGIY